jgi:Putative restriction endonuclease
MAIQHPHLTDPAPEDTPRPLKNGEHLTRAEFERRYEAMPHLKKAELLRGVVFMPSPVRLDRHGEPQGDLVWWLVTYKISTPGVRSGDNTTARMGPEDEPQPDALLMIPRERGGQSWVDAEGYLAGAPELAAEVTASSKSYDLNVKLEVYRAHGVREYLVWRVEDRAVDWFILRQDRYEALAAGADGILRSEVFPGLWLDAEALVAGDLPRLAAVLQEGLASDEHQAFVQRLAPGSSPGT